MKLKLPHLFAFLVILSLPAAAQDSPASATKKAKEDQKSAVWKTYGGKMTLDKATQLATVLKKQEASDSNDVLFEGTVLEVCKGKGCWMVVGDSTTNVRVEFKDYGFFVPWESEGKKVRVQGMLKDKSINAAAAKHMAEEMKHAPVKKENIKEQQSITVFVASGVSIEGRSKISAKQRAVIEGKMKQQGHEHQEHVD